jgi:NADH dehydrogenase [ubiquinone] 1 alpha subcomplex assembly factor 7
MSVGEGPPVSLTEIFRRLIASTGPISLSQFMGEANARYYSSRDPFGHQGDFITAPEISQMFGELIGLWLVDIWTRAGRPGQVIYVELGPGRGTLASDALRVMGRYGLSPEVHFVEASDTLRHRQLEAVPDAIWHHDLSTVPTDRPLLLIANEFLDALPIRQLIRTANGWREVMVAVDGERFVGVPGDRPMDAALPADRVDSPEGTLIETSPAASAVLQEASVRLASQGGAALFIDYGHDAPRSGSTFQAIRSHRKVHPFDTPGEADLTAHVDFASLVPVVRENGARWLGTVTQGAFLQALGIAERAQALVNSAPQHREAIESAKERLVGPDQMGELFKVFGMAGRDWPDGAGF